MTGAGPMRFFESWAQFAGQRVKRFPRAGFPILGALIVVALILEEAVAFADVPVNGRVQRMVFSREEVHAMAADAYAKRLTELRVRGQLDTDHETLRRAQHIAGRVIAQAIALKPAAVGWSWEVHVADTDAFDAFCMAGGKILVSSRFVAKEHLTDGELAALLAHETAHAIAEHVREQLSAVPRLKPLYAHYGLGDVIAALNWDLSISFELAPLARLQELEADDIGVVLAARAGYDPNAMVSFYRKLARGPQARSFIDEHGAIGDRERAVECFAAYAEAAYLASLRKIGMPTYEFSE
jgi:predicted Zn-dependent protease